MATTIKQRLKNLFVRALDRSMIKRELAGIALMLGSLFMVSAIISYHPDDEALYSALRWFDVFSNPARDTADAIHNHFGLFGARMANFLIHFVLGYPVLLLISSFFFWGLSLVRARSLKPALFFFLYSVVMAIDIATMFGLTSLAFSDVMSGSIGRMLAAFLITTIGFSGAWVLLLSVGLLLTFYMGRSFFIPAFHALMAMVPRLSSLWDNIRARISAIQKKKPLQSP
uniref:FtsK/SpoIIIE family protein n=1 Tax=Chlorobium chlorochromatii (strain CaD3) TaxID=340177 RepID=Q3AQ18_CHLCH